MATVEQYQQAIDVFVSGKHNVDDLVHGVLRNHPDLFLKYGYGVEDKTPDKPIELYSQAHFLSLVSKDKVELVLKELRCGNKVAASKAVRSLVGWSLRDSKLCIDNWVLK